jgi:outer membrane protein TolC
MDLAQRMRDSAFRLYQEGEMSVVDYLAAQKRYDEVVADVTVKTDADRIRFLERQVATLKQIEDRTRELFRRAIVTQVDGDLAELARLDAEYALAKLRAKVRGRSNGRASSQKVPE